MAHTQEPWRVGKSGAVVADYKVPEMGGSDDIDYYGGHLVGESIIPSNASRIVACVNACAGISTETLESAGKFPLTKSSLNGYLHMKAQRNELLEALRDFVSDHENISEGTLNFGRAVIASVEA